VGEAVRRLKRVLLGVVCVGAMTLGSAVPAQAAPPEPDFVVLPNLSKGPDFHDPCGIALGGSGELFVSSYYRHAIDAFKPEPLVKLQTRIGNVDPLGGPCGLSFDTLGRIYVNNYHRNVERYTLSEGLLATPTTIDSSLPTGVAVNSLTDDVYVNARTHLTAYAPSGAPLMDGSEPLKIGVGSLGDGYGLAASSFPATLGRLYVPDHADDTVKVYDPLLDKDDPIQVIAGPPGGFGSLRDAAVAVDGVSGDVYVADTRAHPQYSERPEATIYVFDLAGAYKGRLKYNVVDPSPVALAVSGGRAYVSSGNSVGAVIYSYPPGSATNQSGPSAFSLVVDAEGEGSGAVASSVAGIECDGSGCSADLPALAKTTLTAAPDPGSAFAGWSGAGCSGTGSCTVTMNQARSLSASFERTAGPAAPLSPPPSGAAAPAPGSAAASGAARGRSATASVVAQKGNLRVSVSGKMAPKRLPRQGVAPIAVTVGGEISTTDASLPPQLEAIRIELNKGGRLETAGLPTCAYDRIQPGSSSRALSACRAALVGEGSFTANITLAGQEPYPTQGKLLVFNGLQNGKPVLFGHIYAPNPFASSFVIVFSVQKLNKGTYGTALSAAMPKAMDAWGRLTGLQMTLSRRYSDRGQRRSYLSAGCPAPKGFPGAVFSLARTEFSFDDGKKLRSVLTSDCKARG